MISLKRIVTIMRPYRLSLQVPLVRRNFASIGTQARTTRFNSFAFSRLRAVTLKRREVLIFLLPSKFPKCDYLIASFLLLFCSNVGSMTANVSDPSSHSRPDLAKIRHASLSLEVDFENKIFKGNTVLTFNTMDVLNELVLDVSKDMDIKSILLEDGTELKYAVDHKDSVVGSRLVINLQQPAGKDDYCQTSPECDKEQQSDIKPDTDYYCSGMTPRHLPLSYSNFGYHPALTLNKPSFTLHKSNIEPKTENYDSNKTCCSSTHSTALRNSEIDININRNSNEQEYAVALAKYEATKIKMTGVPRKTSGTIACKDEIELFDIRFKITINYATSPNASALQWLDPAQTAGKTFPYVFSQCQPIHARSIMPCQDTPSVKFTYDAEITVPENFTVLMSALRDGQAFSKNLQKQASCTHKFRQPVPIPSYLLAVVAGVLQWKIIGPRTVVWAEGSVVDRAAAEFSDTEKYLEAAESLVGPYVWTQYDLLVLPPSFPFGGMENPCLTFVTPTLLAGDKSQADVIVHEIMHSWTGNLVTNKNFEHFWLNEGFTVFLERKVTALLAAKADRKKIRDFESTLGLQELGEAIKDMNKVNVSYTRLIPNLEGVNPDDAFSRIPYEKGSLFLRYLEDLVGGPAVFDKFVRDYINNFTRMSIDSDEFKEFFMKYFEANPKIHEIQWDLWFYSEGMPPTTPEYDTTMTSDVLKLIEKIESGDSVLDPKDVAKFKPNQMVYLLQELISKPPLDAQKLCQLGEVYGVSSSPNSEIKFRWYRLNIRSRNKGILKEVFEFLSEVGRMKYARPLYRDLYDWQEVRQQAINHFLETEPSMMQVLAYTLRIDLHLKGKDIDNN